MAVCGGFRYSTAETATDGAKLPPVAPIVAGVAPIVAPIGAGRGANRAVAPIGGWWWWRQLAGCGAAI